MNRNERESSLDGLKREIDDAELEYKDAKKKRIQDEISRARETLKRN